MEDFEEEWVNSKKFRKLILDTVVLGVDPLFLKGLQI